MNPTICINPHHPNQLPFAILPTHAPVKHLFEFIAKLPPQYGISPTTVVLTAVNSLSIKNPAILEYWLTQFFADIEQVAAGNLTKLDKHHENEIALALINLWQHLTSMFTQLQLWDASGVSYWKFHAFTNYDIILRYTGGREDELRAVPDTGSPTTHSVP